jgi:hypothetical protein
LTDAARMRVALLGNAFAKLASFRYRDVITWLLWLVAISSYDT